MLPNMSGLDRIIRVVIALALGGLIATGVVSGIFAVILGAIGIIFLATAIVGYCPLYWPLKLSTRRSSS
mgnify:FL=1